MLKTLITLLAAAGLTLSIGTPLAHETLIAALNGTSDTGLPRELR